MADSRIAARAPLRILCQHEHGSCAACCGVYNFRGRSAEAEHARLVRRTERVRAAWPPGALPDEAALARARDELAALEAPDILFAGVKVCPFAGYVEEGRVGCLLHPSRRQSGADLRDLGVYPREICDGHFCAPHDWLRAREADLAQTARGVFYGRVVTDAGLVKALARLLDGALGRTFRGEELARAQPALDALWHALRDWPWRDLDPARFGGFVFVGNEATERSVPSCLAGLTLAVEPAARAVLDALGTRALDEREARAALGRLDAVVHTIADGLR
ncbi:MAG: hypothetical protein A2138_20705 [Deltaproteobacteria bacterium RBG_16_71_12]|nr:MAG: hypothetical protein A2138_20705 [Deltaproteobacteria bacterium RBG_16_71_12]